MRIIPLHSLILIIGHYPDTVSVSERFNRHELLTMETLRQDILGDANRSDLDFELTKEIYHRIRLKLNVGERVVINIPDIRRKERMTISNIGDNFGVPIFYIINTDTDYDYKIDKQLLQGDGLAEIIDMRYEEFSTVNKFPVGDLYSKIKSRGFRGITAVGDVHGMRESLKSAINWATARGHFIIFLGDTIDYGPKPVECINDIYDVVMAGRGLLIYGNHERKIERWIDQNRKGDVKVKLSDGNQITIDAMSKLSKWQREVFENKFKALMCTARNACIVKNILFTHGAGTADMFRIDEFRFKDTMLANLALFGQIDSSEPMKNGYPNRIYDWVDTIPENHTVIVGHDIRSTDKPFTVRGELGGDVVFLDTGSGKGGSLTSADIRFNKSILKVDNFNRH